MSLTGSSAPWRRHLAWGLVFAANLVVPLRLGWVVTEDGGRAGAAAAVASLLLGSLRVVARPTNGRRC